jgi:alpha-beta hydrolase superfamily lysophospholipase
VIHLLLAVVLAFAAPPNQREVAFTSKDRSTLYGTISWNVDTEGASPAFVLIGGSGMQDRDETIGPNKPLADIAAALNAAGMPVLRYDKRGVSKSTSGTALPFVTRQNYIDDVLAAVATLAKDPHVDPSRIYLLGHSEGGELALGAVLQGAPVAGIVMLSPLPMHYADILMEQLKRKNATPAQIAQMQALITSMPFLQSYATVDPRVEVTQIKIPMLLLHGSKDINVTTADLKAFIAAAHDARRGLQYGELDGDNHLFEVLPPATESTGMEYYTAQPLDPRVPAAIIAWLAETQ